MALHAKAFSLATMGLRALLDIFIVRKIGDVGTFEAKLSRREEGGLLSGPQRVLIEAALNAGNAAAHRGFSPPEETVTLALEAVESLLRQDLLRNISEHLSAGIPKRAKR